MNRAVWTAIVVGLASLVGVSGGCSGDDPTTPSGSGGTSNDASTAWSGNACHGCFTSRCTAELTDCGADPTCAVFAECVDECPPEPNGAPSASCVQSCPGLTGGSEVDACLTTAQAECTACGGSVPDAAPDGGACTPDLLCQECAPSEETNPCWKCQDERCCDSDQACRDDQGCLDYFYCFQACTGSSAECIAECDAQVGAEHYVKFNTKVSCILTRCLEPTECGAEAVDPCLGCINEKCAAEKVACDTHDGCARLSSCIQDCTDQGCYDACYSEFASGLPLFNAESDCFLSRCEDVCSDL